MRNLAPKTENDIWIIFPFWEFRCFFGQAVGGGTGKTESSENGCAPTSAHGKIPRHSRRGSIDNAQGVRAEVAVAPENQNAAFSPHDSFAPAAERGQSRRHFCRHAKQGLHRNSRADGADSDCGTCRRCVRKNRRNPRRHAPVARLRACLSRPPLQSAG